MSADPTRTADPHAQAPPQADPTAALDPLATGSVGDHPTPAADGPVSAPDIPGYTILAEVARGGMGVVYRARQAGLNREVALKMLLGADVADDRGVIRFLAEAEAVAAIDHPHVVRVFEFGRHAGRPFLAMEFLPGGTLADRLRSGPPYTPAEAAGLVGKLAAGVQAAHDLGIVHRDVKPGNVLFDEKGEPKVVDFGLAKRGTGADLTRTHAMIGTPAYMAPEQARGGSKFADPAADVWALGVVCFECLTGARPFAGPDNWAILEQVLSGAPVSPRRAAPAVPRDLDLIVRKCLEREPHERYPTAGALAADLGRFAAGVPVSVRAAGPAERAAKWARRNPTRAAAYAFGLLAAVLGGLGGVAAGQWRSAAAARDGEAQARQAAEDARDTAERSRQVAEDARDELAREREKLAAVEYGRTVQVAYMECRDDNPIGALALLEGTRPGHRGWEWNYVSRRCRQPRQPLVLSANWVQSAAFRPDGARVVTASLDGTVLVWDVASGGKVLNLLAHDAVVQYARPLLTFATAYWVPNLGAHNDVVPAAAFSPDGGRIVTASWDGTARVWNAATGAEVLAFRGHTNRVQSASFSPDGGRVVTASLDGTARVWDAGSGAEVRTLWGHGQPVRGASFSPDGARVVTASEDRTARVWDAATGTPVRTLEGHVGVVHTASFSPDGSRLLTASEDRTARVWDAASWAEVLAIKGHAGGVLSAAFGPDGARVVVAASSGKVWVYDGAPLDGPVGPKNLVPPPAGR